MSRSIQLSQAQVGERSFFSQVYMWMGGGLVLSAISAMIVSTSPVLMKAIYSNPIILILLFVVEIGMIFWMTSAVQRVSLSTLSLGYLGFTLLNGVTLAYIFVIYTASSIVSTFAITAGTFIFFSVYGMSTKTDLTRIGNIALMGLFGIIIASVVNIFMRSPMMYWLITYIGIGIFVALIAFKTQQLKRMYSEGMGSAEMQGKLAVFGALSLYLSFINLFILLLRIFGNRR